MNEHKHNLMRDLGLIAMSVVIAVILAKSGILEGILASAQEWKFVGSIIAGLFFVSVFTAAPSAVVLIEIALSNSALETAFFGGIGALAGDLIIFRFVKDHLADELKWLASKSRLKGLIGIFKLQFFRWLLPLAGAIVVASPFPDEIGLAMMGLSKMRTGLFIPLSFALNFLGILAMGLIARAL